MIIRTVKSITIKKSIFICVLSLFVMLPVFPSQATEAVPMTETAAGQETLTNESASTQKAAPSGPASDIPDTAQEQQEQLKQETGMINPVYPIVKEVDRYSYDQMEQDIRAFETLYKDRVKVETLGTTPDGRNIYDIIVGNADSDRQIVIQGGIHAREYITSLLVMKQAGETLEFYDSASYMGRTYSDMLSQSAIHFVPMVNPDGITISQFGEAGIRSPELRLGMQICYQTDVANRATRLDYGSYLIKWKSNAKGVDLNKNYDADWHLVGPESYPSNSGYRGPAPLSEPESLALAYLLLRDQVKACLNYHSMGQVIYWDVSGNKQREPSLLLARQYSASSGYRLSGEPGKGGVKDWVQIKEPSIPSITVEIGSSAAPVSFSEFPAIWQQNYQAPAIMLGFVLNQQTGTGQQL